MNINKKLWSFIFGCLIAGSFVWLVSFGKSAVVLEYFHQYPDFVIDYYALFVTGISAIILTLIVIFIMNKVFHLFTREHPFWLSFPTVVFIILTLFTSKLMLAPILSAAIPALCILALSAVVSRLMNVASLKNKTA